MGREVRRVSPDWEHPTNERGHFVPLFDGCTFAEHADAWLKGKEQWESGAHEHFDDLHTWEEWDGDAPDERDYSPACTHEQATAYRVYENVTEGTPVSPVLKTREDLVTWLVDVGDRMGIGGVAAPMLPEQAERFIDTGFSFSMVVDAKGVRAGVYK